MYEDLIEPNFIKKNIKIIQNIILYVDLYSFIINQFIEDLRPFVSIH